MAGSATLPRIGDPAPDFTAVTTHDPQMTFGEWQGDSRSVLLASR
jgi:alkyl hydroperoxide reductase subunit AhpC